VKHRSDLTKGSILPSTWVNAFMEFVSTMSANLRLTKASATTVSIVAGTDNDQASVGIDGRWRYNTATLTATHPGGAAGTYDVYVTAADNDFSLADPADATNYSFGLQIRAVGSPPATALSRKIGTVAWDGAQITAALPLTTGDGAVFGANGLKTDDTFVSAVDVRARDGAAAQVAIGAVGPAAEAGISFGSASDVVLYRKDANTLNTTDTLAKEGTGGGVFLRGKRPADAQSLWVVTESGRMTWGPGGSVAPGPPTGVSMEYNGSSNRLDFTGVVLFNHAGAGGDQHAVGFSGEMPDATGPASSIVSKIEILDSFGGHRGWVPVYATIT
jgi:hypothetical protein